MTKKTRLHRQVDVKKQWIKPNKTELVKKSFCFLCNGFQDFDHEGKKQELLTCFDCHRNVHACCYELNSTSVEIVQTYDWQCNDCKSCLVCQSKQKENKIVICSLCDRGYHTFCCDPPLKYIPKDDWYCHLCSSMPSPPPSPTTRSITPTKEIIKKPTKNEPVKLRLTVSDTMPLKRKRGRPKNGPLNDVHEDEEFFKTFGHKLTKSEANTKRGTPTEIDILYFEQAKLKAEQQHMEQLKDGKDTIPKIHRIAFNEYLIDTWYVAPYPEEYSQNPTLYICEFCMKYMKTEYISNRHQLKCRVQHPPGDEIYRDGKISIFEVDGRKNKIYCQNLCLMAKMFLDHKTLYYDVEPFLFYIMTETDEKGCHFVGYFSKEKRSSMEYNVSCILTMPIFQRKGYGQFLIDFSYLLSKKENKTGSPERPLSDLGLVSYRSYWKNTIFRELIKGDEKLSIEELSYRTSLTPDDIISTLEINHMIQYDNGNFSIVLNLPYIESHLNNLDKKNYTRVDPEKLTWTPFILSRDRLAPLLNNKE